MVVLSPGNFNIKQNSNDKLLTTDDLWGMSENKSYSLYFRENKSYSLYNDQNPELCKKSQLDKFFMVSSKGKLKAILNQVGCLIISWTLSVKEFHWPEFYSSFSDWFFQERLEQFVRHLISNVLGAE